MKIEDIIINEFYIYHRGNTISIEQIIKITPAYFVVKIIKNINSHYYINYTTLLENNDICFYRPMTNLEKIKYL